MAAPFGTDSGLFNKRVGKASFKFPRSASSLHPKRPLLVEASVKGSTVTMMTPTKPHHVMRVAIGDFVCTLNELSTPTPAPPRAPPEPSKMKSLAELHDAIQVATGNLVRRVDETAAVNGEHEMNDNQRAPRNAGAPSLPQSIRYWNLAEFTAPGQLGLMVHPPNTAVIMERNNRGINTPLTVNRTTSEDDGQADPSPIIGSASARGVTPRHNSHVHFFPGSPIAFSPHGNIPSHRGNGPEAFAYGQRVNNAAAAQARSRDRPTHWQPYDVALPPFEPRFQMQPKSGVLQNPADGPGQRPGSDQQSNPFVPSHANSLDSRSGDSHSTHSSPTFAASNERHSTGAAQQSGQPREPMQRPAPPSDGRANLPPPVRTRVKIEVVDLDSDTDIEAASETAKADTASNHDPASQNIKEPTERAVVAENQLEKLKRRNGQNVNLGRAPSSTVANLQINRRHTDANAELNNRDLRIARANRGLSALLHDDRSPRARPLDPSSYRTVTGVLFPSVADIGKQVPNSGSDLTTLLTHFMGNIEGKEAEFLELLRKEFAVDMYGMVSRKN
ncbi:hypothetical protein CERZMDRAFT_103320 [Cercospora zeae-maydis SCOH1-5]|uniref:Uncharacterized protein n=1 Tax=Cercospora zeae-maydis SCOH1-5 TaxID=717836 RepID=A0A6A6EXS6_9PEZI|nr:hypothetical protein CERZMDRAFT_103320 [Cercospora zeae-maydis SCOH1-5]